MKQGRGRTVRQGELAEDGKQSQAELAGIGEVHEQPNQSGLRSNITKGRREWGGGKVQYQVGIAQSALLVVSGQRKGLQMGGRALLVSVRHRLPRRRQRLSWWQRRGLGVLALPAAGGLRVLL